MPAGTNRTTLERLEVGEWVDRVRNGDRQALARAITAVEEDLAAAADLLEAFGAVAGEASRIGVTGSPGVGKSTLISALISTIRAEGRTVGVIAVDPSSPITSGALLGDRIRLQGHIEDPGVYVRSVAGRGHLGGLSEAVPRIATVLGGAGFDLLLIETVGVGQSEVEVMRHVDTTVVVVTPGWGDSVQTAKAGVLEIGDVYVVNKADLPGGASALRDLEAMLGMGPVRSWKPPVLETVATEGVGVGGLWRAVEGHRAHLQA